MMMIGMDAGIAIANGSQTGIGMGAVVETASQSVTGIDGEIESVRLVDETAITANQAALSYSVHRVFSIEQLGFHRYP